MSKSTKEVTPVTEESKFKGVNHVNVDKTVEAIGEALKESEQVEWVGRQSEISRVGMIMKRVEEDCTAKIVSMKTDYKKIAENEKEYNVLFFRVIFAREWSLFKSYIIILSSNNSLALILVVHVLLWYLLKYEMRDNLIFLKIIKELLKGSNICHVEDFY